MNHEYKNKRKLKKQKQKLLNSYFVFVVNVVCLFPSSYQNSNGEK